MNKIAAAHPVELSITMIRIGPAGWNYQDWAGIVYPKTKPKGFDPLAYLANYFDTVEINTSYYGPPRPSSAEKWAKSVAANSAFKFTAKLFRAFTHERKPAANDERDFKDGIAPLVEAKRFGALLMQFPWSFQNTAEHRSYLLNLQARFRDYPLVVEVRHSSWTEPGILDMLAEMGIGLCNIDQPLFSRSIAPTAIATSSVGYMRLHGRNYKQWWTENQNTGDRYNYLYSVDEIEPWVQRTKAVAKEANDTYAVTNNHFVGKAIVNALEMASILKGEPVKAPGQLVEHYPELREFVR